MNVFGTAIEIGILWFLIVLFTGSNDADQSYRETWIVIIGTKAAGLISQMILPWVALPIELAALYYLVDWACGTDRKTTLKICGWYLVASLTVGVACYFLLRPR